MTAFRFPVFALAAGLCSLAAVTCRADSQATIVGSLLVFYAMGGDGERSLNVVSMEDGADLKITGRVAIQSHNAIHAQMPFDDHIILLLWNQVEVYNLTNPSAPRRVALYRIGSQRAATSGFPRIERRAGGQFLLISPVGAAELSVDIRGDRWSLADVEMTPDLLQKASTPSPEEELANRAVVSDRDSGRPRLLKESLRFRYEKFWQRRTQPGLIIHMEYLRKVDRASGRTEARLLLCEEQETID